jgi:hypothetical protein
MFSSDFLCCPTVSHVFLRFHMFPQGLFCNFPMTPSFLQVPPAGASCRCLLRVLPRLLIISFRCASPQVCCFYSAPLKDTRTRQKLEVLVPGCRCWCCGVGAAFACSCLLFACLCLLLLAFAWFLFASACLLFACFLLAFACFLVDFCLLLQRAA